MKKSILLLTALLITACNVNNASHESENSIFDSLVPSSVERPSNAIPSISNTVPNSESSVNSLSTEEKSSSSTANNPNSANEKFDDLIDLGGGDINNSLPDGWSFVKGPKAETKEQYYANGGLKFQYVGDGLLSNTFEHKNHIEVKINVRSKHLKGKLDNVGDNDFAFSLYGLDSSGKVVSADGILRTKVTVGDFNLLLEGPSITQVKLIYSSSPRDELSEYYNISFGGIYLRGNNSGDDIIKNTEPVNPESPENPDNPVVPSEGKLTQPTNLQFDQENWKITWNKVEHANQYRLCLNDFEVIVSDKSYDNADVLFSVLYEGIINTIKVQAVDSRGKYETSDFAILKFSFEDLKGIYIDEELSYIKNLRITEENNEKIIRIPSNKLSRDKSGTIYDLVIAADYNINDLENGFKFSYEKNDTLILTPEKFENKIKLTFAGVGEFKIYVIRNGTNIDDFIFDSVTIIIEPAEDIGAFDVYIYDYINEKIIKDSTYTFDTKVFGDSVYFSFLIKCSESIDVEHDFTIYASVDEALYNVYFQPATQTNEGYFDGFYMYFNQYGYKGTFTITFETKEYGGKTLTIIVI